MKKHKIVIIGGGIGGLASAALLAKDGHSVTVLEKNEQLGGRASVLEEAGFRFDMGPSWYMMPEVFERFFAEFGKTTADFYQVDPLSPQYRVFFGDRSHIDVTGDRDKDLHMLEQLEPGITPKFKKYLNVSKKKYQVAINQVLYKNMDSILDLANWEIAKESQSLGVLENMHRHISKYFTSRKVQQILEYNLVFLGCSPQNAPALFSLMTHVDFNLGVWYPKGGIYAIVKAMEKIGRELGVEYICNTPVRQLVVQGNNVTKVHTANKTYHADIVISNADYWFTENLLSDQSKRSMKKQQWEKKVMTPSAFILYLGVKGKLPKLTHHNLYFGSGWEKHFADVFDHPQWPQKPSIYINMPSATDSTVAPKGHENLMVLVPIASGLTEDENWREQYAQYIIRFIEEELDIKLKEKIVYQRIFSVTDFAQRYNSFKGNALGGLAHTLLQSAVWRPNNMSKKLNNLYFAGANTVPGIGVPPAVISGHLVRDRIRHKLSKGLDA